MTTMYLAKLIVCVICNVVARIPTQEQLHN